MEPPAAPPPAPGVRLLPASHWADDPRPLYEADAESFQDEPSDVMADHLGYDDWLTTTRTGPTSTPN